MDTLKVTDLHGVELAVGDLVVCRNNYLHYDRDYHKTYKNVTIGQQYRVLALTNPPGSTNPYLTVMADNGYEIELWGKRFTKEALTPIQVEVLY